MTARIATAPFLDALPLVDYFATELVPDVVVADVLPSQIGEALYEDEADVALLPVIEHLRGATATMVPGVGVATTGRAGNVLLFARCDADAIRQVAVDRASRTEVALLRILLSEAFGVRPDLLVVEPRADTLLDEVEAALVVGDRCHAVEKHLREFGDDRVRSYDLGALWHELTGLPFVTATWALGEAFVRRSDETKQRDLIRLLTTARDYGLANLDEITDRQTAAGRLGPGGDCDAKRLLRCLRQDRSYVLGEKEMAGLRRFFDFCVRHEICPAGRSPRLALSQAE